MSQARLGPILHNGLPNTISDDYIRHTPPMYGDDHVASSTSQVRLQPVMHDGLAQTITGIT